MTQIPPDAPMSVRLGARLGPEALASILAVPVVLVAVLVFLAARGSGQPAAVVPPAPISSSTPAVSTPVGATPVAATPVAATPQPTPDRATARIVLQLVDELLANRSDLASAVAPRQPDAQDIANRLRSVNATLITLETPLADLQRDASAADIAARLLAVSDQTSEAVADTQRASITNAAAYKAGGQHVLDVMEPLVAIRVDLIVIVGPIASP
jgi:hypothetical protein